MSCVTTNNPFFVTNLETDSESIETISDTEEPLIRSFISCSTNNPFMQGDNNILKTLITNFGSWKENELEGFVVFQSSF